MIVPLWGHEGCWWALSCTQESAHQEGKLLRGDGDLAIVPRLLYVGAMLAQAPQPESGHAQDEHDCHEHRFIEDHRVRAAVAVDAGIHAQHADRGRDFAAGERVEHELACTGIDEEEYEVRDASAPGFRGVPLPPCPENLEAHACACIE